MAPHGWDSFVSLPQNTPVATGSSLGLLQLSPG